MKPKTKSIKRAASKFVHECKTSQIDKQGLEWWNCTFMSSRDERQWIEIKRGQRSWERGNVVELKKSVVLYLREGGLELNLFVSK